MRSSVIVIAGAGAAIHRVGHRKGWIAWELTLFAKGQEFASQPAVLPAHAGIQYAAAYPFDRRRLWNTGLSAPVRNCAQGGR